MKLGRASYETEWNFFIKSLLNGKTDALIHLLLLIIIITLDLVVIFYYRNKNLSNSSNLHNAFR